MPETLSFDFAGQDEALQNEATYTLVSLELYNWGGFAGYHKADIDIRGTAIIGPTGSGKTTLVDALMTLLAANPRYNLASTGGHESDRDLASYVRGVAGAGDGSDDRTHIARSGKTVTGLAATLDNGRQQVRLGAVLWFDGAGMSSADMKKLWLFSTSNEHTLKGWLQTHREGGMRALRQLDKRATGIWSYPSKRSYLARVRDFFDVRDNAFNLLNRAAGLKQLNSIDDIFRQLVLDDNAQFERAREVADSFDDLTAIHEELAIAHRQQRSLEPIKSQWQKYQRNAARLEDKKILEQALPVWFGEQAQRLWAAHVAKLEAEQRQAQARLADTEASLDRQKQLCEQLQETYLNLGGADIRTLEDLIQARQKELSQRQCNVADYQQLIGTLKLPEGIDRQTFGANQAAAEKQLQQARQTSEAAQQKAFEQGSKHFQAERELKTLQEELAEAKARPGSNIQRQFQQFRSQLATELAVDEDSLPFVGELVQVKEDAQAWHGAIERAIGSHRQRILVPPEAMQQALRWVNDRHNALHVRLLEAKTPEGQPRFFEDGFTRKLDYKDHPHRQAVKALLAGLDRHCVDSPDALRAAPHAMTVAGLMSGKKHFFDKQDQKRIDQDWQTGFDNRDRLQALTTQIATAETALAEAASDQEKARAHMATLQQQVMLLEQLGKLDFEQIDTRRVENDLEQQQARLQALTAPDSDAAKARRELDQATRTQAELDARRLRDANACTRLETALDHAGKQQARAATQAEGGLDEKQRTLADRYFKPVDADQIDQIDDLKSHAGSQLRGELEKLAANRDELSRALTVAMSKAQEQDRGALSEVGRELEDVLAYLQRLKVLTEEALPEKRQRFQSYLTRSSDDGVSQLLSAIEAEVERIEERLEALNNTLRRVDFQQGCYLQLVANKVGHESLRRFTRAQKKLASSRFIEDGGESQYQALQAIIEQLRDACERHHTKGARALLDPRFRLEFKVAVMARDSGHRIELRSGSQGGSGGEKEIIASYVLTASLSYALCPDGSNRPLFGTILLDEAFARSSHVVAGRIIAALQAFHLHALFITPNKEMRLLRKHTRSAIVVHRRGNASSLTGISWRKLDELRQQRTHRRDENTH